jgi:hypothetical protein
MKMRDEGIPTAKDLTETAQHLLMLYPQPVPRYRLLRDVFKLPVNDQQLQSARALLDEVPAIQQLAAVQLPNGSWGRFHSQDTTTKQRFPTTEYAIERALALGLDNRHPVLARAQGFIERHLRGEVTWTDRVEKHDDPRLWPFFTAYISAGRLAQLDPTHPLLKEKVAFMHALLYASFPDGLHDAAAEVGAQRELSDIPTGTHWALLSNQYGVMLLAADTALPAELQDAWLGYILRKPGGIYYINNTALDTPPAVQSPDLSSWLYAHELLSRMLRWHKHSESAMYWLWQQRNEDGLWDIGSKVWKGAYFPLSTDWQHRSDRVIDGSVRILALLRRWVDANSAFS